MQAEASVDESEFLQNSTTTKQGLFLAAYAECGNISKAAEIAICARDSHYKWLKNDPAYEALFCEAQEKANDKLLAEARRRAAEGWLEPVYHQGVRVGAKRRYSDKLMLALLAAEIPNKFSQRKEVHHTGKVEHDHNVKFYLPDNQRDGARFIEHGGNGRIHSNGDSPAAGSAGDDPVDAG